MNDVLLNLGPFNDCVDYLEDCAIPEVVTPTNSVSDDLFNIFYYSEGGLPVQSEQKHESVIVPVFTLGMAINGDTQKNRQKLLRAIELKILIMIYKMADQFRIELKLQNIVIPVKEVYFDFDGRNRLCIAATLGIVVFENSGVIMLK